MIRLLLVPLLLLITPASAQVAAVTVQSCNREVSFPAPPQAAVSNDVNLTEMMLVLGLQDHMVGYTGVSGWKTLDERLRQDAQELPELAAQYPGREVLIGAGADFFFAGWNYGMRVGGEVTPETLEPYGIRVYELTESCAHIMNRPKVSLDDLYTDIINLGRIFGVEDRAEALVGGWRAEVAEMTDRTAQAGGPRVFVYDSGEDTPFTAGRYAMPTALIEAAGGNNIMETAAKSWTTVSWEEVIERDPEVIVIVNYGDVTAEQKRQFMMTNPVFSDITAVREDNFVTLDYVEATPGPRNIEAIRKLVEAFVVAETRL